MQPDIERYRQYVDHLDIADEKKNELIHTVWLILQNGFDRALGEESTQICIELKANKVGQESASVVE
uniref:hypothetical protein n=1 Tax=Pararhizobium sp. IMCC3301 TaxID=3067904 RepID=UPI002741BE7B|nr:hypothetical protein [Pararhizobium sp. IMCC3301]